MTQKTLTTSSSDIRRPSIIGTPVPREMSARSQQSRDDMTVEQVLSAAALDLRKIYPFLFAAFYAVPRIESVEVNGVSVSPSKLYYNSSFIKLQTRATVLYFMIHGLYHILMRHHIRGFAKDPSLWNQACDLYINKCLADAYGAKPGEGPVVITNDGGDTVLLEIPEGEKYDDSIDVKRDTPEDIYRLMMSFEEDDKDNSEESDDKGIGEKSGDESEKGDQGKNAEEGEGEEGEKQSEEEGGDHGDEEDRPSQEDTPKDDASSDTKSDQPSNRQTDGNSGDRSNQEDSDSDRGQNKQEAGTEDNVSEPSDQQKDKDKNCEGGSQGGAPKNPDIGDIIDDVESRSQSPSSLVQDSRRLLSKIDTIYRQQSDASFGRGTRYDPVAQAEIDEQRIARINWLSLLRSKLIAITTDEKSLSHPDRRFVHTGLYVEGTVVDESELRDIKVCVDTSASMSDIDVQIALLQIQDLLKVFHVTADLIFWDEEIEAVLPFNDLREYNLARNKALGRGGTNPECLFEAFEQTNRRGHTVPVPSLVIIFTDGFFETPNKVYRRAFNDKTLWVLCSEKSKAERDFEPGFGTVVALSS